MKDTSIVIGTASAAVVVGVIIFLNGGNMSNLQLSMSGANNSSSAVAVPFTKIASGTQSNVSRRVNYFITSPSELEELWKMINTTDKPPAVDFKKNAIIAVFAGKQPTVGHVIEVAKIEDSSVRNVSLTLVKPDANCLVAQTVTAPYEIIAVPTTTLPLTHEDSLTINKCIRD